MQIRIGQVWRPNSGTGVPIAIVDNAGPGFYVVRSAYGDGDSRVMSASDLTAYTHDPDAIAY